MSDFIVNGQKVHVNQNQKLIHYLRDTLHLTSVKNGCGEGACGTCMILVDGKATKSCILNTDRLEGKHIITVEGLTDREKSVYAYAFAEAGAVQCGFCTPGMVISAKGLIDQNAAPTEEQIRHALRNNICRCTGYTKIVTAVTLAANILRENMPIPETAFTGRVGENMHRVDAVGKTLGEAEYVDDLYVDQMLYGSSVRSAHPRAIVKHIYTEKAKAMAGVKAVITAKELPGATKVGHIKKDWDVLIAEGDTTRYMGDAIVLIAAETKEILEAAKKAIDIQYEVLKPLTCPADAMKEDAPLIHEGGNILSIEHLVRGNADEKIKHAEHVVTNRYSTPFTEHAFLEPETALAVPDRDGMIIYCADQGIYQTRKECAEALGLKASQVRVVSKMVGGGFGGKEDMSVQHHAAILAYITKQPVKVSLSRKESLIVHPKRHAMEMEFTTACDAEGNLTAMKATIISDTGAYASLGGPVLQRACTHAAGPYNYQDIDILGKAVYTNNPPGGAFRGFGVTQSCFAIECNLNQLAEQAGLSPWEFRYKNAIRPGQILPNGQIADDYTAFTETLEAVKEIYDKHPKAGIACAMKNSGLGVGIPDTGRCRLIIKDGKINTHTSAACIGQGLATVMTQMICQVLGVAPCDIIHCDPDTTVAPNSGNTTASRQTVFTGEATKIAANQLKEALETKTLQELEGEEYYGEYTCVTDPMGSDKPYPYSHVTYGYATHVVVLDDEGKLSKVYAAHDVGTPINPNAIEGQIQGGVVMSLGYALTEDYPLIESVPQGKFGTLGLLKANQVPDIQPIIVGKTHDGLAHGAKGIGEICSIPTAPAVAQAYYRYDGLFRRSLPLDNTPYSKKSIKK
ncbi:selenium-dependent xanthine dehydrogenase [Vallitalea pronyensis]|uniref:Selenium-dependent xanthine dehydrogenase n=1 Tax=Vallitalea pronyensis TaxID=1348613 RepID=A0A8J8MQD6_9FIRM|nr:selenium-dependent xanthine dehydrogenase [Vallitalea pronyensis]QUI25744.1 selenium-dependent xanthine dehydrogenase [Vallitalea pronyensis]